MKMSALAGPERHLIPAQPCLHSSSVSKRVSGPAERVRKKHVSGLRRPLLEGEITSESGYSNTLQEQLNNNPIITPTDRNAPRYLPRIQYFRFRQKEDRSSWRPVQSQPVQVQSDPTSSPGKVQQVPHPVLQLYARRVVNSP